MFKKQFHCWWLLITLFGISLLLAQSQLPTIVVTGSVVEQGTERPIEAATVFFQSDSLRFMPQKTDELGFFLFKCPSNELNNSLKYFIYANGFIPHRGAFDLQRVNEPIFVQLKPAPASENGDIVVMGQILDAASHSPLAATPIHLRIGNIILPDIASGENGNFSIVLSPADLGKVATYRIKKAGYAPRYGYITIQKVNPPLKIELNRVSLVVAGYIKNQRSRTALEKVQIMLQLGRSDWIIKYTSKWGFFTHTFDETAAGDTLFYEIIKSGFKSVKGRIIPHTQKAVQLSFDLQPLAASPFYKNKYFLLGSAGAVALMTSIIILSSDEKKSGAINDLPLPPVPPED